MNSLISILLGWIDFVIHLYVHTRATINAIIVVSTKATKKPTKKVIVKNNNSSRIRNNRHHRPPLFDKIPNEILMMMFEYMNPSDLYQCATVSRHWNKLIVPILWKSPVPNKPIISCLPSFAAIDKKHHISHKHQKSHFYPGFPIHLPRYGYAVKSLDLSRIASHVTDCTIRHILHSCPHLIHLNLSRCRLITDEALLCLAQSNLANQLQVLSLQNCRQVTDIGLDYLSRSCHRLQTLHLGGCSRITSEGIISLVTASGNTIRRLRLSDSSHVMGSTLHAISRLCGPRLEWLDIARTEAIRHTDLEHLVQQCPNITRLNVSMKRPKPVQAQQEQHTVVDEENPLNELIELLNHFNVQANLTQGSALHRQSLIDQQRMRDTVSFQTVQAIATNLKKLQHLNLSHWSCLTDKAVQMLSVHTHCLTYLNLIGCQSVTERGLKYLSDLCERKSTCITLSDLMISPASFYSYESDSCSTMSEEVRMNQEAVPKCT